MTVHLIKLCVGVDEVKQLFEWQEKQAKSAKKSGKSFLLQHITRNMPKRKIEILDGGSIYWVIKGLIQVRQRIVALDSVIEKNGEKKCALVFDPELIQTVRQPRRAFQGWRYLESSDVPMDLGVSEGICNNPPSDMLLELKQLGLI